MHNHQKILFSALVLSKLEEAFPWDDIFQKPIPFVQVAPSTVSVPIMIASSEPGRRDDPVNRVGLGQVEMNFIAFFDWNQLDYRDLQYYRVRIARFDTEPHLVGREALIERQYASIFYAKEYSLWSCERISYCASTRWPNTCTSISELLSQPAPLPSKALLNLPPEVNNSMVPSAPSWLAAASGAFDAALNQA